MRRTSASAFASYIHKCPLEVKSLLSKLLLFWPINTCFNCLLLSLTFALSPHLTPLLFRNIPLYLHPTPTVSIITPRFSSSIL
jgi:hypothetical protein